MRLTEDQLALVLEALKNKTPIAFVKFAKPTDPAAAIDPNASPLDIKYEVLYPEDIMRALVEEVKEKRWQIGRLTAFMDRWISAQEPDDDQA